MLQLTINDLTREEFLSQYWQKKPLLIKQGLKSFKDFLSADELAGLACDDQIESRLVYQKKGNWHAEFGPFQSYQHLGNENWSLIVQAVNNWVPATSDLINCFNFIPRWRFDDVMASFATPGGGVGPHIDLYDVFICQGSGKRRWRVGNKGGHKEFAAHEALLHTEPFEAIIDEELSSGDILYIPPGFPHEGVTLENSMSFSVGYRTSSAQDMHSALADHLIDNDLAQQQIADPERDLSLHVGKVDNSDFIKIKQHLLGALDDVLIQNFSGLYLTKSKCELDLPEQHLSYQSEFFRDNLQQNKLFRLGGLRCLYFENAVDTSCFYANGEAITIDNQLSSVIPILCNNDVLNINMLTDWIDNDKFIQLMTLLINKGYWYFDH